MPQNFIVKWHSATVQKAGNSPLENEDQFSPVMENGAIVQSEVFRCALADGATQSIFARQWAKHLVDDYVEAKAISDLSSIVEKASKKWGQDVKNIALDWPAQEKMRKGAYSTLLGIEFGILSENPHSRQDTGNWCAFSIGDTCLFQYRKEFLVKSLPGKNEIVFNNSPKLIGSLASSKLPAEESPHIGDWRSGDDFFLMTDALAEWAYKCVERSVNVPGIIKDKLTRKSKTNSFSDWISNLRNQREIRNDDTTLIWIKIY